MSKKKFGLDRDEFEDIVSQIGRDRLKRILDRGSEIVAKALDDVPDDAKPASRLHSVSLAWSNMVTATKLAAEIQNLRAQDAAIMRMMLDIETAKSASENSISLDELNKARMAAMKNSGAQAPLLESSTDTVDKDDTSE